MLNYTVVTTNSTSSSELFISNDDNDEINNNNNLTSNSSVVWNENVKINETETTTTTKTTVTAPKWMIEFVEFRKRLFLHTVEPIIVQILGPGEEPYDVNDHFLIRHHHPNYFLSSSSSSMLRHHQHDYDDKTIEFNMTGTVATSSSGSSNLSSALYFYGENQTATPTRTLHRQQHHHRQLGFLPDYVENASSFRETSMTFATLITLFVTMASVLLIFLSCFYHNQK
jgi:hypothetical protein